MKGTAHFGPGGEASVYRYSLTRILRETPQRRLMFLMLNPSTATADKDDPTIRRCIGYAKRWGFNQLMIGNVFAYRSTDPKALAPAAQRGVDIIGPENDFQILEMAGFADMIIAAWGQHGGLLWRSESVSKLMRDNHLRMHCLKVTKYGEPCHPLYLRGDLEPFPFTAPSAPARAAPSPAQGASP